MPFRCNHPKREEYHDERRERSRSPQGLAATAPCSCGRNDGRLGWRALSQSDDRGFQRAAFL
jgi:hypothetical protein